MKKFRSNNKRSCGGTLLAETPAALYLLFLVIIFPLASLGTVFYRASILYFANRIACTQAAKASTYTIGSAAATALFNGEVGSGINVNPGFPQTWIYQQAITSVGTTFEYQNKIPTATGVDTKDNLYYVEEVVSANLDTLIPGVLPPYPITFKYRVYSENPTGLTK